MESNSGLRQVGIKGEGMDTVVSGGRHPVSQGSNDDHAQAGANSEGDLAASENSVINIFFKPDLGLFRTVGVDLNTTPGCGCRRPSPCMGAVEIELTLTMCKSSD